MTTDSLVSVELRDAVTTITISRPEQLNALNNSVLSGLEQACREVEDQVRANASRLVLLRSAGDKAFVAGADIKEMLACDEQALRCYIELGQGVMSRIESLPVPVIAVVQGFALGGGMELALACDLIVASQRAVFGQPEVLLGLVPGFGGTQRLVERCGIGRAKRLILTGKSISAEEAQQLGVVEYVFSSDELEQGVLEICDQLLKKGPLAVAAAKRLINQHSSEQRRLGLAAEVEAFLELRSSADANEGMQAFVEKRKAMFSGS